MRRLFCFICLIHLSVILRSQSLLTCSCDYFSNYKIEKYKNEVDSIGKKLSETYVVVATVGSRSFKNASLLFLVKDKKTTKGFFYDLANKKNKVIEGLMVEKFHTRIFADSLEIVKMSKLVVPIEKKMDHDMSYFILYRSLSKNEFYEICGSQMINSSNKTIRKTFDHYFDFFK